MAPKRKAQVESDGEVSGAEETEVLAKEPPSSSKIIVPVPEKQTDAEGNTYFEISGKRRVTIRSFNGMKLVDIREMYTDKSTGELKPGKKGISLAEEQFMGLINVHSAITEALNELDAGGSSSKKERATKITKTKAVAKPVKSAKTEASKPAKKKKARKVESDDEEEDE
ncbi:RNA polymerase II transcriptional coactivator SUB1 [Ceratobasidium sp. AG-Ba]|nr:RNA polymerase II transcriptional coactivator SUB1 [Ceratobasidium sp. AG-Ba]QRW12143.1 RNA polymerase II transcriptional coactivator SUB1 [Ceratobasidium sp. AG-Ba]